MNRRLFAWLVPAIFLSLCASASATVQVKVFEATFTRGTGTPITESRVVYPFSNKAGNAIIQITNGGLEDSDTERVSSSYVHVNGQVTFGPSDFSQKVYSIQKDTYLFDEDNYIDVTLNGKPGGKINIQVFQIIEAEGAGSIGPSGGTILVNDPQSVLYGTKVIVPQGVFTSDAVITVSIDNNPPSNTLPDGMSQEGPAISFTSSEVFQQPVHIVIPYNGDRQEGEVRAVYTYNSNNNWEIVIPSPTNDPNLYIAMVDHFSTYVKGKEIIKSNNVRTDFTVGEKKDSMKYHNSEMVDNKYVPDYCPTFSFTPFGDPEPGGVCLGIGMIAAEYFNNPDFATAIGESLNCRWKEYKASMAACEVQGKYLTGKWGSLENLFSQSWEKMSLGFLCNSIYCVLDYSNIIDQIIINAKKNKVTPISMHWANGGHKVVALGWQKTGYSDGVIPIYQVNNNSVEEYIKYYKEYSSILRKNITKMTYTSPKGKTIVQYSIKQEVSSQDIVTTISRFATEGTCTSPLNWPKIYGGQSAEYAEGVQQTSDGGYIFAGNISYGDGKANVYLVKTDASGNELWSKTFRERNANYGKSIKQISDGGYIIAGYTGSDLNGGSYFDVYLVKTDSNGNMLWSRTFGGTNNEFGLSVQQTSDGGYIIVGSSGQFVSPGGDVYVIKTDSNGYMLWSKTLGGTNHDAAYSVQQTSDGGYIIAGWTLTSGWSGLNAYLVKTDPNGDMLWSKTFVGTSQAAANSVQQTSDGGYIIAGYTYSTSGTDEGDAYLVKTDKNGDMLWSKTFGGAGWDSARAVLQTPDAGYIIVGYTSSFGVPGGDVYLVKTDSNGNMLWSKISGIVRNYPFSGDIQQTSDGGYIIAGSTSSETNWQDAYLIKTDSNGNIQ